MKQSLDNLYKFLKSNSLEKEAIALSLLCKLSSHNFDGASYSDGKKTWNVGTIYDYVKHKEPGNLDIDKLFEEAFSGDLSEKFDEEFESKEFIDRANKSSLEYPIMVLKTSDGFLDVIDGNHRLWKAKQRGHRLISAYIITEDELSTLPLADSEPDDEIDWESRLGQTVYTQDSDEELFFGVSKDDISRLHEQIIYNSGLIIKPKDMPFKYLASGAYRAVYSITTNPDYVIKFAQYSKASDTNKAEYTYQVPFGGLFPKVFAHGVGAFGTDFDWIIVEKVHVIKSEDEYMLFFPKANKIFDLMLSLEEDIVYKGLFEEFISAFLSDAQQEQSRRSGYEFNLNASFRNGEVKNEELKKILPLEPGGLAKLVMRDPLVEKIYRLGKRLNLNMSDVRPGNVGVDSDGNFVIIDIWLNHGAGGFN